jgi:hypothetical protein
MPFLTYFWGLLRRSFHGTFRALEIGEALTAMIVHVLGYFVHEWKDTLEILFVALLGALLLTFLIGLLVAAHFSQKEIEKSASEKETELRAEISRLNAQLTRPDITDEIRREAHRLFHNLSTVRRLALKRIAVMGCQTSGQLEEYLKDQNNGVISTQIAAEIHTGFELISRDRANGTWIVNPHFEPYVKELLATSRP